MQNISDTTRSDSECSLFKSIESPSTIVQCGWGSKNSTPEGQQSIIETANKSIKLVEYLQSRMVLELANSNSSWQYKAYCPFHKHGQERSASFFINTEQNRFYCQACGITGGISEYIAWTYKRPVILVANHILSCLDGNFVIDDTESKKAAAIRKKFQIYMLKMSDLYRSFIRANICDEDAVSYINKCYHGFDNIIESNPEGVEKSIEDIYLQFETYLIKYSERKK